MSKDERPISDQIKQVVDELQLEERVKDAAATAEQAVLRGLDATGSYLRDHRNDIEGFLDRASAAIDRQTSGRFAEQVEQVRAQLTAGVASLADREWTREPAGLEPPASQEAPRLEPPAGDPPDAGAWSDATET
jgi:hypothetical protein